MIAILINKHLVLYSKLLLDMDSEDLLLLSLVESVEVFIPKLLMLELILSEKSSLDFQKIVLKTQPPLLITSEIMSVTLLV